METIAKAIPKFEVPTEKSNLEKHRHQQTENILDERGIKYEMKFLNHQFIKGQETYQIRTVEKSAATTVGNSAHLCQKILADLKEAEGLNSIFPAIVVIKGLGKDYVMIDGRHRLAVLSAKGKEIPAYIVDSNLPEGDCFALATVFNDNHGTPNDLEFRKKHATQQAINYINAHHTVLVRGEQTRLINEAAKMFQLTVDSLTSNFEIDESERLMRRVGASENAIGNIGSQLKRNIRTRLKTGEPESSLKLINAIAGSGLEQKATQEIIKRFKESSNLELSLEIKSASKVKEDGKVKSAGEISRDQTADRFVQTINGALGLLEDRKPQSLRLSVDQKSDVRKDLLAIAKEAARWSRLFEEELDA